MPGSSRPPRQENTLAPYLLTQKLLPLLTSVFTSMASDLFTRLQVGNTSRMHRLTILTGKQE